MDPQQISSLNALAPYLALSSSANSPSAAATCISQAIGAPNTYIFAELLSKPNIQALRNAGPQHSIWLKVLEIFSWGTWRDYQCEKALLPYSFQQLTLESNARWPPRALPSTSSKIANADRRHPCSRITTKPELRVSSSLARLDRRHSLTSTPYSSNLRGSACCETQSSSAKSRLDLHHTFTRSRPWERA